MHSKFKVYNIKNYNSVAKVSKQNYAGIAKRLFFLYISKYNKPITYDIFNCL